MERKELLEILNQMLKGQFDTVVGLSGVPEQYLSAPSSPQATRAGEVVRYFESRPDGLDSLANAIEQAQEASARRPQHHRRGTGATRGKRLELIKPAHHFKNGYQGTYLVVVKWDLWKGQDPTGWDIQAFATMLLFEEQGQLGTGRIDGVISISPTTPTASAEKRWPYMVAVSDLITGVRVEKERLLFSSTPDPSRERRVLTPGDEPFEGMSRSAPSVGTQYLWKIFPSWRGRYEAPHGSEAAVHLFQWTQSLSGQSAED